METPLVGTLHCEMQYTRAEARPKSQADDPLVRLVRGRVRVGIYYRYYFWYWQQSAACFGWTRTEAHS
jgi:hypothetical protein